MSRLVNHWITSSARSSSDGGIVRPSALAVFEVDHQLELRGLFDGKIAGLGALEDLVHHDGKASEDFPKVGAVRHETSRLHEAPVLVDCREPHRYRQLHEPVLLRVEEGIRQDQERVHALPGKGCCGMVDVARAAHFDGHELYGQGSGPAPTTVMACR